MITIQSVMLVMLGVLSAVLLGMMLLPAYRKRTERLTEERIRRSMPVTEAEIRADKDRLRAQFAIRVHKLEAQVEQAKLSAARQLVELNRRDAAAATLAGEVDQLKAEREDLINAKRVLEHTISDRLPRLEQRLLDAQTLIRQRDSDISSMTTDTQKSVRALDEALQINAQQRAEIERLNTTLRTRAASNRELLADPRFEGEVALKAEIEALRAQVRDQASLIGRLESGAPAEAAKSPAAALAVVPVGTDAVARERDSKLYMELKAKADDQATEIVRLKAELDSLKGPEGGDSRIASKARLSALQAQVGSQTETIQRLRAELAASNERLARQAQHFMDEMRRIGAGTLPASGPRRPATIVEQAPPQNVEGRPVRRSLSDRINQVAAAGGAVGGGEGANGRVADLRKVLSQAESADADDTIETTRPARVDEGEAPAAQPSAKARLLDRISGAVKSR